MKPDSPVADTSVRLSDDPPERSAVFAREGLEHRTRKVDSTFGSDPKLIPLGGASFCAET
jgi:hypothetical protein